MHLFAGPSSVKMVPDDDYDTNPFIVKKVHLKKILNQS
jgi:hypothetical protein